LRRSSPADEVTALRDIDLEIPFGSTTGIIGRNGSGKTTLLRILAGVTAPTAGSVCVVGRTAPLIGVGVGFDPELTGRENVLVNGQVLGMRAHEVAERFQAIIDFAELGDFIEVPVKTYSSGMFLRLAFAVAIHADPDVLLVDEILAVGDLAFQQKCLDRMNALQARGATIVVVTHSLDVVNRLCSQAVLLDRGAIARTGTPEEVIGAYHDLLHAGDGRMQPGSSFKVTGDRPVVGGATVHLSLADESGDEVRVLASGRPFAVRFRAEFAEEIDDPVFGIALHQPGRGLLYVRHTTPGDYRGRHGPGRPLGVQVTLQNRLLRGEYAVQAAVLDPMAAATLGASGWHSFSVVSRERSVGIVDMDAVIEADGAPVTVSAFQRIGEDLS